jgi:hypothetical protein
MAANEGWFGDWFANGWFPAVWFAPSDESHLLPEETAPSAYRRTHAQTSQNSAKRPALPRAYVEQLQADSLRRDSERLEEASQKVPQKVIVEPSKPSKRVVTEPETDNEPPVKLKPFYVTQAQAPEDLSRLKESWAVQLEVSTLLGESKLNLQKLLWQASELEGEEEEELLLLILG